MKNILKRSKEMEQETIGLEMLIKEILEIPNNTKTKEELEAMQYIELLDYRDGLYNLNIF